MLSIIIPVYNADKFLTQCLKSLCNQDLPSSDYEIIIINDGSSDGSSKIIQDFQEKQSNIIAINQENKGVSAARNAGLEIAKGEYITFIDADDEIYPHSLKNLLTYATENNLDLLYPKITYIDAAGKVTGEFLMDSDKEGILDGFQHQRRGFIFAFYKKILLSTIRFNPKIPIAEDSLFNIEVHTIAKRCGYKNWNYYKYRREIISSSSSTFPQTERAFVGFIEQLWCIRRLIDKNRRVFTQEQIAYFDRPYYITIEMMTKVNIIPTLSISRFKKLKREMEQLGIAYIAENVMKTLPYFKAHWFFFFAYHSPKVIEYRIKTYIYRKLIQFKIIKKK